MHTLRHFLFVLLAVVCVSLGRAEEGSVTGGSLMSAAYNAQENFHSMMSVGLSGLPDADEDPIGYYKALYEARGGAPVMSVWGLRFTDFVEGAAVHQLRILMAVCIATFVLLRGIYKGRNAETTIDEVGRMFVRTAMVLLLIFNMSSVYGIIMGLGNYGWTAFLAIAPSVKTEDGATSLLGLDVLDAAHVRKAAVEKAINTTLAGAFYDSNGDNVKNLVAVVDQIVCAVNKHSFGVEPSPAPTGPIFGKNAPESTSPGTETPAPTPQGPETPSTPPPAPRSEEVLTRPIPLNQDDWSNPPMVGRRAVPILIQAVSLMASTKIGGSPVDLSRLQEVDARMLREFLHKPETYEGDGRRRTELEKYNRDVREVIKTDLSDVVLKLAIPDTAERHRVINNLILQHGGRIQETYEKAKDEPSGWLIDAFKWLTFHTIVPGVMLIILVAVELSLFFFQILSPLCIDPTGSASKVGYGNLKAAFAAVITLPVYGCMLSVSDAVISNVLNLSLAGIGAVTGEPIFWKNPVLWATSKVVEAAASMHIQLALGSTYLGVSLAAAIASFKMAKDVMAGKGLAGSVMGFATSLVAGAATTFALGAAALATGGAAAGVAGAAKAGVAAKTAGAAGGAAKAGAAANAASGAAGQAGGAAATAGAEAAAGATTGGVANSATATAAAAGGGSSFGASASGGPFASVRRALGVRDGLTRSQVAKTALGGFAKNILAGGDISAQFDHNSSYSSSKASDNKAARDHAAEQAKYEASLAQQREQRAHSAVQARRTPPVRTSRVAARPAATGAARGSTPARAEAVSVSQPPQMNPTATPSAETAFASQPRESAPGVGHI